MHHKALSRFALASAIVFAIGACGDSGSGGPAFDGEATTAETENAADDAASMMTQVTYAINFGGPNIYLAASAAAQRLATRHPELARGLGAQVRDHGITMPGLTAVAGGGIQLSASVGCSVESRGNDGDPEDPIDANDNGIPDDWYLKYTCVTLDSSDVGNILTYNTSVEMQAKENTASLHGFTAKLAYHGKTTEQSGDFESFDLEVNDVLDIRAAEASEHLTTKARDVESVTGVTTEESAGEERTVAFDPDGSIVLGDPLPDGELSFNGRQWFAASNDVSLSFTIETTTPLAYDAACFDSDEPPFTDGTVVGRLNGGSNSAMFTINFTACGSYNIEVDNTSDEPVVVTREFPSHGMAARR